MRTKAKWLQSATMMAFLAVVALFVSPVLALGCCCNDAAPSASTVIAQKSHCHDEAAVAPTSHHAETGARCASVRDNCDCDDILANATFIAPDNARFFAPIAVVVPTQTPLISFVADARCASYAHFAARPRLPDRNLTSGRAPPALATS